MNNASDNRLDQMAQKLEALEAEYQEFTYIVSHDLRGPLRTIGGFVSIISEKNAVHFDEKSKHHAEMIVKNVEKSQSILDALLAFSRINTTAEPFSKVDCNKIVDDIKRELSDLIKTRSAQFHVSHLPEITADHKQIAHVFYHLIQNALIYQDSDAATHIAITTEANDTHWTFIVSDNGIGIKPNVVEKIFKPLRRAVKDRDYPGLGMGLALANKIVQRHEGEIYVKQKEAPGSTFCFTVARVD